MFKKRYFFKSTNPFPPPHNQGGGGKRVLFQNVWFFNYFRPNKSEPDLTDDYICTVFLNVLPNRFRLEMEPHELIWKSVTANLHRYSVSIFKMFFKIWDIWNLVPRFLLFRTQIIIVFVGPVTRGHVQEFTDVFSKLNTGLHMSEMPNNILQMLTKVLSRMALTLF